MREIYVTELEDGVRSVATLLGIREPRECAEGHVPGPRTVAMSQLLVEAGVR